MHVISFTSGVEFTSNKSGGAIKSIIEPYQDYVFSNVQRLHQGSEDAAVSKLFRQSYLEARIPVFKANPLGGKGERVLFYTGAGGYGDQVMAWPVVRQLSRLNYKVDVLVDPGNEPCWQHLDFVGQLITLPCPLTVLRSYHHLALFELVTNADGHPGQLHPTDNLLSRVGIDPRSVSDEDKLVQPPLTVNEQLSGEMWKDTAIYQLGSSNPVRNLSATASIKLLKDLQDLLPVKWVAIADKYMPKQYYETCEKEGVALTFFEDIRELMAAVVYAKLTVGPDSFTMHLRGHAKRPAVAYFGPLDPGLRTAYYPSVISAWASKECSLAPCYLYTNTFPPWCPSGSSGGCAVVTAAPKSVLEAVSRFSL